MAHPEVGRNRNRNWSLFTLGAADTDQRKTTDILLLARMDRRSGTAIPGQAENFRRLDSKLVIAFPQLRSRGEPLVTSAGSDYAFSLATGVPRSEIASRPSISSASGTTF